MDFFFFLIPIFQTYIFLSFLLSFFFHPSLPPPLFPPHPRFLSFFLLFFFFFFHLSFLSFLQHRKVYCRAKQREGFLGGSVVSNAPANAGDTDLIRSPGRSRMLWSNEARGSQNRACALEPRSATPGAHAPRAHVGPQEKPPQ